MNVSLERPSRRRAAIRSDRRVSGSVCRLHIEVRQAGSGRPGEHEREATDVDRDLELIPSSPARRQELLDRLADARQRALLDGRRRDADLFFAAGNEVRALADLLGLT